MAKKRRVYRLWLDVLFGVGLATPFVIINKRMEMRYFSTAFSDSLGYKRRDVARAGFTGILIEGENRISEAVFESNWRGEIELQDFMFRLKDGSVRCFDANVRKLYRGWMIFIFKDVNRLTFDGLTGLLNRQTFNLLARAQLRIARRLKKVVVFFTIDLNNFKMINDSFGHLEGDKILKAAASALKACFHRQTDLIGRVGGDEFAVLIVNGNIDTETAMSCFRKMFEKFAFVYSRGRYKVGASAGYACCNFSRMGAKRSLSLEELLQKADESMYKDKEKTMEGKKKQINLLTSRRLPKEIRVKSKGINKERVSNLLGEFRKYIEENNPQGLLSGDWTEADEVRGVNLISKE